MWPSDAFPPRQWDRLPFLRAVSAWVFYIYLLLLLHISLAVTQTMRSPLLSTSLYKLWMKLTLPQKVQPCSLILLFLYPAPPTSLLVSSLKSHKVLNPWFRIWFWEKPNLRQLVSEMALGSTLKMRYRSGIIHWKTEMTPWLVFIGPGVLSHCSYQIFHSWLTETGHR